MADYGAVASEYDRVRPGYPDRLLDDVVAAAPGARDVVEIGCGTGKGSVAFARRGLRVVGVEASPQMAALARGHLAGFDDCRVEVARFEDWDGPAGSADLVAAAQSWHWLDFDVAVAKVRRLLRPGGMLAVFANTPRPEATELRGPLDTVYRRYAPDISERSVMTWWAGGEAESVQWRARLGGAEERRYDWECTYSTEDFVSLLGTHSDHWGRESLLAAIAEVIDGAGGSITFPYRSVLLLAALRANGGSDPHVREIRPAT